MKRHLLLVLFLQHPEITLVHACGADGGGRKVYIDCPIIPDEKQFKKVILSDYYSEEDRLDVNCALLNCAGQITNQDTSLEVAQPPATYG